MCTDLILYVYLFTVFVHAEINDLFLQYILQVRTCANRLIFTCDVRSVSGMVKSDYIFNLPGVHKRSI